MELLQNIDPALLPYIAVGCPLLCAVIVVIGFALQTVGSFFDVIFGFIQAATGILEGGPMAWCGCILLLLGCIACAGIVFLFATAPGNCAEYPTRFCEWFGFLS